MVWRFEALALRATGSSNAGPGWLLSLPEFMDFKNRSGRVFGLHTFRRKRFFGGAQVPGDDFCFSFQVFSGTLKLAGVS